MIHELCLLKDLPETGAREFEVAGRHIFVLRVDNQVKAYLNLCPHLGTPLNWEPDAFLDNEGTYIRCANHGALFLKDSGDCIAGPCRGMPLTAVPVSIENAMLKVEVAPRRPWNPMGETD